MSNFNNNPNNFSINPIQNSVNVDSFWLNPMFNNFNNFNNINNLNNLNNMPQNNMNSFVWGFQNNPMNNLQQSFINFGGNAFQMPNNINNINNMNPIDQLNMSINNLSINFNNNNNFNFPFNNNINNNQFKKFNSEEISSKMNINNFDSEIEINFRFMNSQSFKINAKLDEKLIDVINKFKNNECPQALKDQLSACICKGNVVQDLNKTLSELNIQNGEGLLFVKNESEEDKKKEEMKYELTERENKRVRTLKIHYERKYLNKNLNKENNNNNSNNNNNNNNNSNNNNNNNNNNSNNNNNNNNNNSNNNNNNNNQEEIPSFIEYLRTKDNLVGTGIKTKEHKGKLVYCLTNKDWNCSLCKQDYSKENAKYFCSICDFSMCENCHYEKKYYMKKSFPKGCKPSNPSVTVHELNTDYHPHKLVYCRSSRSFLVFNKWFCDNCRKSFENRVWSFYCTQCDFDLCCDCCGYH